MKNLTINIIGEVNSGKTSVAHAIKKVLVEAGLAVEVNDFDDDYLLDMSENILNIKGKVNITINVVQTRRS